MSRLASAAALSALLAYSAAVETSRLSIKPLQRPESDAVDSILKNQIKTGDLVLFSHRWYRHHVPKALYVQLYQLLYTSDYDHAGIIVEDKYGEPYIFERNLFFGYNVVPYETKMNECNAYQIMVIPLVVNGKSDGLGTEYSRKLMNYALTATNSGDFHDAEAYLFCKSIFYRLFSSKNAYCPNVALAMSFFSACGTEVSCNGSPTSRPATHGMNSIMEKAIKLNPTDSSAKYKLGPNIMVKTDSITHNSAVKESLCLHELVTPNTCLYHYTDRRVQ